MVLLFIIYSIDCSFASFMYAEYIFLSFANERKGAKCRFLLLWDIISIQKRSD